MKARKTLLEWCQEHHNEKLLELYALGGNKETASVIGFSSRKRILLKCPVCEMSWSTSMNDTIKKKRENLCPYCSHIRAWKGYNLAKEFPDIVSYWDYEKNKQQPEHYIPGSHEEVAFKCARGHTWNKPIREAVEILCRRSSLCPLCNHSRPSPEYNLEIRCPEIAREWDYENNNGLSPRDFLPYSQKEVQWKCSFNPEHHWKDRISNRTILHRECKLCNKQYKISYASRAMFYYLKMEFPDAECEVSEIKKYKLDILLPSQMIVIEHDGCYYHDNEAAMQRALRKDKALMEIDFQVIRVKEKMGDEIEPYWEGNVLWYSFSEQNRTMDKMIEKLILHLSDKSIKIDHWNDYQNIKELYFHERKMKSLAMVYPELSKEWSLKNLEKPDMISTGVSRNYLWTCPTCNRDYPASIPNRVIKKSGCPFCSNRKVSSTNNLAVVYPNLKKEWDYEKNEGLMPEKCFTRNG